MYTISLSAPATGTQINRQVQNGVNRSDNDTGLKQNFMGVMRMSYGEINGCILLKKWSYI